MYASKKKSKLVPKSLVHQFESGDGQKPGMGFSREIIMGVKISDARAHRRRIPRMRFRDWWYRNKVKYETADTITPQPINTITFDTQSWLNATCTASGV